MPAQLYEMKKLPNGGVTFKPVKSEIKQTGGVFTTKYGGKGKDQSRKSVGFGSAI